MFVQVVLLTSLLKSLAIAVVASGLGRWVLSHTERTNLVQRLSLLCLHFRWETLVAAGHVTIYDTNVFTGVESTRKELYVYGYRTLCTGCV